MQLQGNFKIKNRITCYLVDTLEILHNAGLDQRGFALTHLDHATEVFLHKQTYERLVVWHSDGVAIAAKLRLWHPNVTLVQGWALDPRTPDQYGNPEAIAVCYAAHKQGVPWPVRTYKEFKK
jgi:hypothetical protein